MVTQASTSKLSVSTEVETSGNYELPAADIPCILPFLLHAGVGLRLLAPVLFSPRASDTCSRYPHTDRDDKGKH